MMGRLFALAAMFLVTCTSLDARGAVQTSAPAPASAPAFTIADVHPSPWINYRYLNGDVLHGDRYTVRQATMLDLISIAWGVDASHVQGGPSWLEFDRFDIVAQAPAHTPQPTLKLMLRSLLAARFHLVTHPGNADLPAYVLTALKPKLAESSGGNTECLPQAPPASVISAGIPILAIGCHNMSMDQFAQILQGFGGGYFQNKPLVDSTGLKSRYDFSFYWTPYGSLARAGQGGVSLFDAVEKQLGLKLELRTAPRPVLLVDSVDRAPTPNPPGIERALPPEPPAQFEVAVIKPSRFHEQVAGMTSRDAIDIQGDSLKDLIQFAWNLSLDDDTVVAGLPSWASSDRYDIHAKASAEDVDPSANGSRLQDERARLMLQTLLIDRFAIQYHFEQRPIAAYNLEATSPKLKPADPSQRTKCSHGPGPGEKDPHSATPMLDSVVHCQNITLQEFGRELPYFAWGTVYSPALDQTGLRGRYDFTLSFTSADRLEAAAASVASQGASPAPRDPNGAISLFDALRRELGLRLIKVQRPLPVLIIDHINREPAAN